MQLKLNTISIIDDDEIMLFQLQLILKQLGFGHVCTYQSSSYVVENIDDILSSDVLFIDINMPDLDGIQLLRELANKSFAGHVIIFSGETPNILNATQKLAEAHSLNVVGCVLKPVNKENLMHVMSGINGAQNRTTSFSLNSGYTLSHLQDALKSSLVEPFFQPKVCTKSGRVVSLEVLARIVNTDGTIVSPINFIPLAEEHNLIDDVTNQVVEKMLIFYRDSKSHLRDVEFSINLSVASLQDVTLPDKLIAMVNKYHMPISILTLEITESILNEEFTTSLDILTRLRLKGFGLSIDDFGTGYSSMSQLNAMPFTELKVDKEFVQGAESNDATRMILESSVELGKKLDLTIVAEGVESVSQMDMVSRLECDQVQGFLFSKPLCADEFMEWFKESDVVTAKLDDQSKPRSTKRKLV